MEEHRLKPMSQKVDINLFKSIYKETEGLKRKLTSEINPHRFRLESSDIMAAFDIKLLFVFQKYYSKKMDPGVLKGHVIKALQVYKNRMLRYSYSAKFINNPVELNDVYEFRNNYTTEPDAFNEFNPYLEKTYEYMRGSLSHDAFQVFDIELNPPPYITSRMLGTEKHDLTKLPPSLIAEYLDFGNDKSAINYVLVLKQDIKEAVQTAKEFFSTHSLTLS